MNALAVVLLADAEKPGLLDTLPPWGLVVAGVVLMVLAGLAVWINKKKFEDDSLLLEMAAIVAGVGGVLALYRGIFGG